MAGKGKRAEQVAEPPVDDGLEVMLGDPGAIAVREDGRFAKGDPRIHVQPAHEPDAEIAVKVRAYSAIGVPQVQIAILVGMSVPTMQKYYQDELDRGSAEGVAKVANTLFARATTGKDLGAAIFYLKAKAGWSEKNVVEVSGKLTLEHLVAGSMKPNAGE